MVTDAKLIDWLDSIIKQTNDLRNAIVNGTINYPDGEDYGRREIDSFVHEADDAIDTIVSYYL